MKMKIKIFDHGRKIGEHKGSPKKLKEIWDDYEIKFD